MSSEEMYELREVRRSLSENFTLHIDHLDVYRGECLGLVGPTGAGKSTLLRLLAGLEPIDGGTARLEAHSLASGSLPLSLRRRVTMVHQRPVLLTGSVRYNVAYGLRLRGIREQAGRVDAMLERLGLVHLAPQQASTLSGGQMQLVALARALVIEPDVLLLDEPSANLDPAHVTLVEDAVSAVQRERDITIVWTTHNLFQTRRVSHRTVLLLNGQLVETAATEAFFESPADPRTADFVEGRMVY